MSNGLDKQPPLLITKYKFRTRSWITPVLQKSISIKNKNFRNYIKKKGITQKNELIIIISIK